MNGTAEDGATPPPPTNVAPLARAAEDEDVSADEDEDMDDEEGEEDDELSE
jgi:hypothetical protein